MKIRVTILVLVIFSLFACQKQENKEHGKPSEEVETKAPIRFISKLSNDNLFVDENEYVKINEYLFLAQKSMRAASVVYLDRTDHIGLQYSQRLSLNLCLWNAFAINRYAGVSNIEGGTSYFSYPTNKADVLRIGENTFMQKIKYRLDGTLSRKNSVDKKVKIEIPILWARFDSRENIVGFSGVFDKVVMADANYLIIATVRPSLQSELNAIVQKKNGTVKELAQGKEYNLVMASELKFWKSEFETNKVKITENINAYTIYVSW